MTVELEQETQWNPEPSYQLTRHLLVTESGSTLDVSKDIMIRDGVGVNSEQASR